MGNSGSSKVHGGKNYNINQHGQRHSRKVAENSNDKSLWITTPTSTSVFSELDKHSYAAEILEDTLKPISEVSDEDDNPRRKYGSRAQNGSVPSGITGDFNGQNSLRLVAKRKDSVDAHREFEILKAQLRGAKSTETLTHRKDVNDNVESYPGTLERVSMHKSNPALQTIPFATLERVPPQRSASTKVIKMEAGPWQHQRPSHKDAAQNDARAVRQRGKVERRSTWTPSTSRFKKIFLLNKPEVHPPPVYVLAHSGEDRVYQRTADGQIVALSNESTLRTRQWVAQHSHESAET